MMDGINVVFPHFFYLPIVMTAYWFPRYGVIYPAIVSIFYILEYLLFGLVLETIPQGEWFPVLARSVVYMVVGTAMTVLRCEGFTLDRAIDNEDEFVFMKDRELGFFYFSPSAKKIIWSKDPSVTSQHVFSDIMDFENLSRFKGAEEEVMDGETSEVDLKLKNKEESIRICHFKFTPLISQGKVYGYESVAEDVTDIMVYKEGLEKALEERTALLSELHHRVRNNLVTIIGLLDMQASDIVDEDSRRCLMDAEARIMAISSVQANVFQNDDLNNIDLQDHLVPLLEDVRTTTGHGDDVSVNVSVDGWRMGHIMLTDISIIINEMFINAIKHAFPEGRGTVTISLQRVDDEGLCHLSIADNSVGLPEGFDLENDSRLGLKVVRRVIRDKLQGELHWNTDNGTEWTFVFPFPDE